MSLLGFDVIMMTSRENDEGYFFILSLQVFLQICKCFCVICVCLFICFCFVFVSSVCIFCVSSVCVFFCTFLCVRFLCMRFFSVFSVCVFFCTFSVCLFFLCAILCVLFYLSMINRPYFVLAAKDSHSVSLFLEARSECPWAHILCVLRGRKFLRVFLQPEL